MQVIAPGGDGRLGTDQPQGTTCDQSQLAYLVAEPGGGNGHWLHLAIEGYQVAGVLVVGQANDDDLFGWLGSFLQSSDHLPWKGMEGQAASTVAILAVNGVPDSRRPFFGVLAAVGPLPQRVEDRREAVGMVGVNHLGYQPGVAAIQLPRHFRVSVFGWEERRKGLDGRRSEGWWLPGTGDPSGQIGDGVSGIVVYLDGPAVESLAVPAVIQPGEGIQLIADGLDLLLVVVEVVLELVHRDLQLGGQGFYQVLTPHRIGLGDEIGDQAHHVVHVVHRYLGQLIPGGCTASLDHTHLWRLAGLVPVADLGGHGGEVFGGEEVVGVPVEVPGHQTGRFVAHPDHALVGAVLALADVAPQADVSPRPNGVAEGDDWAVR